MCESFGLGEVGSWSPNGHSSQFTGFPRDTFPWGTDCTASRGGIGRVESKVRVIPLEMVASDDRFLEIGSTGRPISLGFAWNNLLGIPGPPVGQTTSCKPPRGESWVPLVAFGCLGELICGSPGANQDNLCIAPHKPLKPALRCRRASRHVRLGPG